MQARLLRPLRCPFASFRASALGFGSPTPRNDSFGNPREGEHSRRHWFLGWAAITILLALLGLAILERQDLSPTSQPLFNEMVEFHGPLKVRQGFVASQPGLCRVALLLARKGRTNRSPVIFHLSEGAKARADLATVTINASRLEDVTTLIRRPSVYQSFSFWVFSNSFNN